MGIEFIPITEKNMSEALKLHVSSTQTHMVETVEESYDEARQFSLWRPVVISLDNELIGFAMYGLWKDEGRNGRVWLDRYFIDERYQGRGYSKVVLPVLLQHIIKAYHCKKIYLSVYENNDVAIHLYKTLGFIFNGEMDVNGEKVMTLLVE